MRAISPGGFIGGSTEGRQGSDRVAAAENGRADPNEGRALLYRDLVIVTHPHGQFFQHCGGDTLSLERVSELTQLAEPRARHFWVVDRGRQQHQANQTDGGGIPRRFDDGPQLVLPCPMFRRLAGQIHLDEQLDATLNSRGGLINSLEQRGAVDGMNHVELGDGFFCLVRLEVSDQVPFERQVGQILPLLLRFLQFVLAEVDLAVLGRRAYGVGAESLRDSDETDMRRIASGPVGGARDVFANVRQPGTNRGGVEHYFGSCATRAFAVAALGPSGESFKYVLNSAPASASLPSFTSAMPSW